MSSDRRKKAHARPGLTARIADPYALYQKSVQDPPADIGFLDRVRARAGVRVAKTLREDFCGTALMCADWVKSRPDRTAVGIDLHEPTQEWGRLHNLEPLGAAAKRVELLTRDVRQGAGRSFDVIAALNFSYCVFKTRKEMLEWGACIRRELAPEGMLVLDIHGGLETLETMEETTRHGGFTYVWDQRPADPITGNAVRHIHFRFPDGTELRRAFTYDWRIWTLPEIRDILADVGFAKCEVYWEGTAPDGSGNGVYRRVEHATEEASWVSYVIAWR
jgi:hypothetical protein